MAKKGEAANQRERPALTQRERSDRVLSSDQPTDQLTAHTVRGGAIGVIAQVARMGLQILSVAVLARLLLPEHFGLVAMGGSVTALIGAFTELNASAATIQRAKLDQELVSGIFFVTLATSLLSLAIGVLSIPVATYIYKDDRIAVIVLGLALSTPVGALGAQHISLLTRNMKWMRLHSVLIGGQALGILTAILAAWLFHVGYWALIIQTWVSAIATTVLAWIACPWRPSWVRNWSSTKRSIHMGVSLTGASIMVYFSRQFDNVLVGWRWGAVSLGYYARAYTLLQTPLGFLTGPLSSALIPVMSQLQEDRPKWRLAYLDSLAAITFVGGAMGCLLYGGASAIVYIALGPGWNETVAIFSNLVIAMLAATPMRTTGWLSMSLGRTGRLFVWSLISTPVYVASFVIGLPYGAKGVALGYSLSQLLAFFPCFLITIHGTNIKMRDVLGAIALPTLATIAIGVGLRMVTSQIGLIAQVIAIAAAGLIYLAVTAIGIWYLPIYSRLKARAVRAAQAGFDRLKGRSARPA